jgi:CheY-like chemotaxis protein
MSADEDHFTALSLHDASVVIVEDQNFVRELLSRLLASLQVRRVTTAGSAEEALTDLEQDPYLANVVLVDFELPGMNGIRFIEKLRASQHACLREIPVVMLTGHNDIELYRHAARLGISAFLVKPAGPATLKSALEQALSGRRISVPRPATDTGPSSES